MQVHSTLRPGFLESGYEKTHLMHPVHPVHPVFDLNRGERTTG
jgi:hypothetical protein